MPNQTTLKAGSLLLAEGTLLPASVTLASEPYAPAWRLVESKAAKEAKARIERAGWKFFFLATELATTSWGWNEEAAVCNALQRIGAQTKAAHYNCVEIKQIGASSFLGFARVKMTAHSRHIQQADNLAPGRARTSHLSD